MKPQDTELDWLFDSPPEPEPAVRAEPSLSGFLPSSNDSLTLGEARKQLLASSEKGAHCPCCNQHVKIYKRKLNSNMAEFLCSLVRNYKAKELLGDADGMWVHFKECKLTGLDYSYLAVWGLTVTKTNLDSTKKGSGLWKPTQKGIDFAGGRVSVPSHAFIYNNEVLEWSDTLVYLRDVFDRHFDYAELMR